MDNETKTSILKRTTPRVIPYSVPDLTGTKAYDPKDISQDVFSPLMSPKQITPTHTPTSRSRSRIQFNMDANTERVISDDSDTQDNSDEESTSTTDQPDESTPTTDQPDEDGSDEESTPTTDQPDEDGSDEESTSTTDQPDESTPTTDQPDEGGSDKESTSKKRLVPPPTLVPVPSESTSTSVPRKQIVLWIESTVLNHYRQYIDFSSYLRMNYVYYISWVRMVLGLNDMMASHFHFCLARSINMGSEYNPMGVDLEIWYVIHRLEKTFHPHPLSQYVDTVQTTLQDELHISETEAREYLQHYQPHKPLILPLSEFMKRLTHVPNTILDQHSLQTWRLVDPSSANQKPYPITPQDLLDGEAIAPPASRHIGIQVWKLKGMLEFLPKINAFINPKTPREYAVTYY